MNLTMHELQISPVAVTRTIPNAELHLLPKNLQIQVVNNEVREAVCCMVSYFAVAAHPVHIKLHRRYPKDWWQAFRRRWCPRWWLARHPVHYSTIDINRTIYTHVCPHLPVDRSGRHVTWVTEMSDNLEKVP